MHNLWHCATTGVEQDSYLERCKRERIARKHLLGSVEFCGANLDFLSLGPEVLERATLEPNLGKEAVSNGVKSGGDGSTVGRIDNNRWTALFITKGPSFKSISKWDCFLKSNCCLLLQVEVSECNVLAQTLDAAYQLNMVPSSFRFTGKYARSYGNFSANFSS
jgi:hypothetical protein